ncbi:MAG: sialidase [Dokdonella sp.]|nr:MAG: sialidase [Dokdonella sp.]
MNTNQMGNHGSALSMALGTVLMLSAVPVHASGEQSDVRFDSGAVSGLGIRNIGSAAMSGRIAAIDARVGKDGKTLIYVGSASGGVWKSDDGGTTFKPVFDKQPVQSIGAVAIDPSNPQNVWVGTGEPWTRNSVSIGNGVYRSVDGGETWVYLGLPESERIADIVIDPGSSDTVYVCASGKLWSDSADRGLYKTTDGGKSWQLVLKGANVSTGCASVSMDPRNSDLLFASLWDHRRKGWTFRSGGESPTARSGSGLFRSADGGRTWTELSAQANAGFPAKPFGRIAVTIAPSNPQVVYSFVESTDSALFRSDDGGKTWEKRDKSQMMVWRPFYFAKLVVDPTNPDRVFKPNLALIMSLDGGKSFANVGGGTHGDHHDIWIDPGNPQHVITADDGGLWQSFDGGNKWWKQNNLPISQFYRVSVDDADPFQVYGGLQDNSSWVGQSDYPGGVANSQWENMYGGDGFWMFSDPANPDYLYAEYQGGAIGRINRHTHELRNIQPMPNYQEKLRWNWNTPISLSPHEKGTIYIGAQFLFRSRDQGQSWDRISGDLTTNNPQRQRQEESGGITVDNSAAEAHTTIFSINESTRQAGLIWVGTDDGNVQVTRDAGKTWNNVTRNIKGLPANSWVSWVQPSGFDAGTAYATFDRHTYGDMAPYIYKTQDFGKSWTALVTPGNDKSLRGYVHVIREDAQNANLLFAGTEFGLWISLDGGTRWAQFKGNDFPAVAVRDIAQHKRDNSLVLATHGRGIWIIDDITPLRALENDILAEEIAFLPTRMTQQRISAFGGWAEGDASFSGPSAPTGADISYFQKSRHLFGKLKIEVLDANGNVLDTLPASVRRGINHVFWSMRAPPPRVPKAAQIAFNSTQGPRVPPGTYTVRLTKNKQILETKLVVGLDRRATFSAADRQAQYDAAMRVAAIFENMSALADRVNSVRAQAMATAQTLDAGSALRKRLDSLEAKTDVVRKKIVATKEGGAITGEERLREHADVLYGAIMSYDGKPADYQLARIESLKRELADIDAEFTTLQVRDLADANSALKAAGLQEIKIDAAAGSGGSGGPAPASALRDFWAVK